MSWYKTQVIESKTKPQMLTLERQVLELLAKDSKSAILKFLHWTIVSTWGQNIRKAQWRNRKPPPRIKREKNEHPKRQIYKKTPLNRSNSRVERYMPRSLRQNNRNYPLWRTERKENEKTNRNLGTCGILTKSLSLEYQKGRRKRAGVKSVRRNDGLLCLLDSSTSLLCAVFLLIPVNMPVFCRLCCLMLMYLSI